MHEIDLGAWLDHARELAAEWPGASTALTAVAGYLLAALLAPWAGRKAWRLASWPFREKELGGLAGAAVAAARSPESVWEDGERLLVCPGDVTAKLTHLAFNGRPCGDDLAELRAGKESLLPHLSEAERVAVRNAVVRRAEQCRAQKAAEARGRLLAAIAKARGGPA